MNTSENALLAETVLISTEKMSSENIGLKRKLPSETLRNHPDVDPNNVKLKMENVEKFLNEAGLNLQLIDKNDKKFVKLNIDLNNFKKLKMANHLNDSNETINSQIKISANIGNRSVKNGVKFQSLNMIENSEEIDLPSESDLSNMITIVPTAKRPFNKSIPFSIFNNSARIQNSPKSMPISYKCSKCNKLFSNENLFRIHEHTDCLRNMNSLSQTTNISVDETKEDPVNLISEIEQMSEISLSPHLLVKANSTQKHVQICNECGMQFDTQSNLIKHIQKCHQIFKSIECTQCNVSFFDQQSKNRHDKESHTKPFRCYICSFEFTRASNLRAHLHKVHSNEIGKLVNITKTVDNKLKFEFNLDAINEYREQIKNFKTSPYLFSNVQTNPTLNHHSNSNSLVCLKDTNTKQAEIQDIMVYVDGKAMYAQSNTKQRVEENVIISDLDANNNNIVKENKNLDKTSYLPSKKAKNSSKSKCFSNGLSSTFSNKPVAKIPYLLAAAAASTSSQRKQQTQLSQAYKNQFMSTNKIVSSECARSSCYTLANSNHLNMKSSKDLNKEQEYIQLVSLLKQKNEKLFNPLLAKNL